MRKAMDSLEKLKDCMKGSGLKGVVEDLSYVQSIWPKMKAVLEDAEKKMETREGSVRLWLRDLRDLSLEVEDLVDLYDYQVLAVEADEEEEQDDSSKKKKVKDGDCKGNEVGFLSLFPKGDASSSNRNIKQRESDDEEGNWLSLSVGPTTLPSSRKRKHEELEYEVRIPLLDPSFVEEISDGAKKIRERFDAIAKQKVDLQWPTINSEQPSRYVGADDSSMNRPTGCLPTERADRFVGRDEKKKELVEVLIRDGNPTVEVLALVGMGGIGKTTLCQHIYNDSQITEHFDLRGWVHVGEFFDVKSVINNILGSFTDEDANYSQVSKAQEKLMKQVQGKRFLLIMDDVWCQNTRDWEIVLTTLKNMDVKEGCKILVTTRDHQVAEAAGVLNPIQLDFLSPKEGWSLFCKCANIGMNGNHNSDVLVQVGKKIVAKCKGLPLAIKVMGSLMRNKGDDVDAWREISKSDFSDIKEGRTEILGPLYLSYLHLPSHLKACFKFIHFILNREFGSLEEYDAEKLIDLWLAYNLINQEGNCSFTEQGNRLLDEFESRSFLERVPAALSNLNRTKDLTSFQVKVHDLIFDVAQFALNKEICITDDVRHLIIYSQNCLPSYFKRQFNVVEFERCGYSPSSVFYPKLRLLHLKSVQIQFHFKHLRVLFIEYSDMEMIPDSLYKLFNVKKLQFIHCHRIRRVSDLIGNLKNLRSLSFNDCWYLEMIPESVSKLTALEELRLYKCSNLKELPDGITTLANLRCLDVQGTAIRCLPDGITRLTNLGCLDVGGSYIKCLPVGFSNLRKLKHLPYYPFSPGGFLDQLNYLKNLNLKGHTLSIKVDVPSLQVEESKEVELGIKGQFSRLRIAFSRESMEVDGGKHEKILHYLKPQSDIRELIIYRYNGARLPLWICDGSFHQLVYIQLWMLNRCKTLSPLHQLPSLEKLVIYNFDSLEKLVSEEDWGLIPVDNVLDSEKKLFFPKLEDLVIRECDAMEFLPVYQFTALQKLEIYACRNLESIQFVDPSSLSEELGDGGNLSSLLTEIHLYKCPELCFSNNNNVIPPQSLKTIRMGVGCRKLVDWRRSNPNSKWIDIIIQESFSKLIIIQEW